MDLRIITEELVRVCRESEKKGNIVITGHDMPDSDSVISAVMLKKLLDKFSVKSRVKLPTLPDNVTLRDMKTLGIWNDELVSELESEDLLLLVDHHKSFYNNEVIGCVDHHTTPPEPDFDFALILKASSCGKIIYDMADACHMADDFLKKMALYSIYLDTQSCRSSKFNRDDLPWIDMAVSDCAVDVHELERMGFCLISSSEPVEALAMYGYKKYEYGGVLSASTCIQIDASEPEWEGILPKIIAFLQKKLTDEGFEMWAFVLNMPMETRSDIYFIGREKVEIRRLCRLASRSKDVIPVVSTLKINRILKNKQ